MTIPKEVRERIEREAIEAAEKYLLEHGVDFRTDRSSVINARASKAYAACYVKLKCEEWERERWIPVPKELGPWPPDGSVLTFDPTKQVGQRIEQRSNYVGEWPKTVTLYRHLPQPPTQP